MKPLRLFASLTILALSVPSFAQDWEDYVDEEVHVATHGDDANDGLTPDTPVATLKRALDIGATREMNRIVLQPGVYRITKPLVMGPEHNWTWIHPSDNLDGDVVISGGRPITGWTDNGDGTWSATIPEVASGDWTFRQLWIDDKRAVRAREPDDVYFRVEKVGEDRLTNFTFKEGDIPEMRDLDGLELVFLHDWSISRVPVKSIERDIRKLTVRSQVGCGRGWSVMDWFEKDPRYFLENRPEFLDTHGEWYLDRATGRLTVVNELAADMNDVEVIAPVAKQLLVIQGTKEKPVEKVRIDRLRFEHTGWAPPNDTYWGRQACTYWTPGDDSPHLEADPAALQFDFCTSGNRVKLNHCSISHHGPSGAWARRECSISFFSCEVTDCGANGIMIGEGQTRLVGGKPWWQEAPYQASDHCSVWDCDVSHCGRELYGAVGIWVGLAEGVLIRESRIHDLPYTGVSLGWMWWNPRDRASPRKTPCRRNRIEGNSIHDCMQILSDGGGIYCLGRQPESTIAWNEIYNIPLNAGRAESNGMFLDQGTGGFEIHNNLIYTIDKSPLRFHKGWENLVRDNVMVPGKDVPPVRYNDTVKERIERKDNITSATIEEAKRIWEEQRQRRYGNTER